MSFHNIVRSLFAALLLSVSSIIFANDLDAPETNVDMSREASRYFTFDEIGLSVDMFGLFGVFRVEDLVVPSNNGKLPIVVARVLDIHRDQPSLRVPFSLGNWDLEVPRITGWRGVHRSDGVEFSKNASTTTWSNGYCNNPVYSRKNETNPKYSLAFWSGLTLDIPGVGAQSLLFAPQNGTGIEDVVYPNIKDIDATKGAVTYITNGNWKAECLDLPQGARSGFTVTSPDGTAYRFDRFASPRSDIYERHDWHDSYGAYVYPSLVTDIHGNTLTYEYVEDNNGQLHVKEIYGSDGRHVSFDYEDWDLTGHAFWEPIGTVKYLKAVKLMSDDGGSVVREIGYGYVNRSWAVTHCWNKNAPAGSPVEEVCHPTDYTQKGLLDGVTLADGTQTLYSYSAPNNLLEAPGYSDFVLDGTIETKCDIAFLGVFNCGPTYSTLPARLTRVETPRLARYDIEQNDRMDDHYSKLSSRAGSANANENYTWRVEKVTVDPVDITIPSWEYNFSDSGLAWWDEAEKFYSEYNDVLGADYKHKDLYAYYVEYPNKRKDEFLFYRSANMWKTGDHAWEVTNDRFINMVGGQLKQHTVMAQNLAGEYEEKKKTTYFWETHKFIGDNSADCWIIGCDKPEAFSKKLVEKIVEQDGHTYTTQYSDYDVFGLPKTIVETGSRARTINYEYEHKLTSWVLNLLTEEKLNNVVQKTFTYYPDGTTASADIAGIGKTYEYDTEGNLFKEKWVRNSIDHETVFEDFYRGAPRTITKANGTVLNAEANADGLVKWQEDEDGNRTSFYYDSIGRLARTVPPSYGEINVDWFQEDSNEVIERIGGGLKNTSRYDKIGRLRSKKVELSSTPGDVLYTYYQFDELGQLSFRSNPTRSSSPTEIGTRFVYDVLGRKTSVIDTGANSAVSFCYGLSCNEGRTGVPLVQDGYIMVDSRGFETIYNFESFGSPADRSLATIIQQTDKEPNKYITTDVETNSLGQITKVARGAIERSFEYNANNLLWKRTDPESKTVEVLHDEQGNIVSRSVGALPATLFTIDKLNRTTDVNYQDHDTPNIHIEFNERGEVDYADNGIARLTYTYDKIGQVKTETLLLAGALDEYVTSYNYDGYSGFLSSIVYPSNNILTLSPDSAGRPTELKSTTSYTTLARDIEYDAFGSVSALSYGNGYLYSFSRDLAGLPDIVRSFDVANVDIVNLDYGFDSVKNITSIASATAYTSSKTMKYDGIARLTEATGSWGTLMYDHDAQDNISSISVNGVLTNFNYDARNRLESYGSKAYQYDDMGNLYTDGVNDYIFDMASHMRYAMSPTAELNTDYDTNGNKVLVSVNGEQRLSFYNIEKQLMYTEELVSFGRSVDYIYLQGRLISEIICDAEDDDYDGTRLSDCMLRRFGLSRSETNTDLDGDKIGILDEYKLGGSPTTLYDSDADGIPDDWEVYWGFNPNSNVDATDDEDGDNLTNIMEYNLGVNPTSAFGADSYFYDSVIVKPLSPSGGFVESAVDAQHNVYILYYQWFSPANTHDYYLVKYGADGDLLWDRSYGAGILTSLTIDSIGNIYMAGSRLLVLDALGNMLESVVFDDGMNALDIVVSDASVYLAGEFSGAIDFDFAGTDIHTSTWNPNWGANGGYFDDAFLTRLDKNLNYQWTRSYGAQLHDSATKIVVLPDDSAAVVGDFQGSVDFNRGGAAVGFNSTISTGLGNARLYISNFSSNGALNWVNYIAGDFISSNPNALKYSQDGLLYTATSWNAYSFNRTGALVSQMILPYSDSITGDIEAGHNELFIVAENKSVFDTELSKIHFADQFGYAKSLSAGGNGYLGISQLSLLTDGTLRSSGIFSGQVDFSNAGLLESTFEYDNGIYVSTYKNSGYSLFVDSDGDGIVDSQDTDNDNDGMPDTWEIEHDLSAFDASSAYVDSDEDGLSNLQEYQLNTDPWDFDSDNDGMSDGEEVLVLNSDPNLNIPVLITIVTSMLLN